MQRSSTKAFQKGGGWARLSTCMQAKSLSFQPVGQWEGAISTLLPCKQHLLVALYDSMTLQTSTRMSCYWFVVCSAATEVITTMQGIKQLKLKNNRPGQSMHDLEFPQW